MLHVAVAQFSSDGNATCYVLLVLRRTSRFHIMMGIARNRRRHMFRPVRQVAVAVGRQTTLFIVLWWRGSSAVLS